MASLRFGEQGRTEEQLLPRTLYNSGCGVRTARPCLLVALVAVVLALPRVATAGDLHYGDGGRAVASLQRRLVKLDYLKRGEVDGVFGDETWNAVVAFQGWRQIHRDGVVGPQTRRALRHARRPQPWLRLPRAVEIDLTRQVLLVVVRHTVRRVVHASTGGRRFPTPQGRFTVIRHDRMSWSRRYHVWLPYALYFDRGWAIHAFRIVPDQPASHGCIRIPIEDAPFVFRAAPVGTPLIIRGVDTATSSR